MSAATSLLGLAVYDRGDEMWHVCASDSAELPDLTKSLGGLRRVAYRCTEPLRTAYRVTRVAWAWAPADVGGDEPLEPRPPDPVYATARAEPPRSQALCSTCYGGEP